MRRRTIDGRVGIARVGLAAAKDHQLQVHPDLRRRQARTLDGVHGLEHVAHQQVIRFCFAKQDDTLQAALGKLARL